MDDAVHAAAVRLERWLEVRSKSLGAQDHAMLGPTLDGTYFYRLGENESWDQMALGDDLDKKKAELKAKGFPAPTEQELFIVTLTNNRARARAAPHVVRCAKHFPGGDERIELTESKAVAFTSPAAISEALRPFEAALGSSEEPGCVMLGHSTYRHEPFGAQAFESLGPLLPRIAFEDVPASINPGIITFLKHQLGYRGIVVADYVLMGGMTHFLSQHWTATRDIMFIWPLAATYYGTYAGVDLLLSTTLDTRNPGSIETDRELEAELSKLDPAVRADWDHRLSEWLYDFSRRLGAPMSAEQIARLSMPKKITLKTPPFEDDANFARAVSGVPREFAARLKVFAFGRDVWNRSGVLTLLQRQFVVEALTRRRFARPPSGDPADETRWFRELMSDRDFRTRYDQIAWDGPAVQASICRIRESLFSVAPRS